MWIFVANTRNEKKELFEAMENSIRKSDSIKEVALYLYPQLITNTGSVRILRDNRNENQARQNNLRVEDGGESDDATTPAITAGSSSPNLKLSSDSDICTE